MEYLVLPYDDELQQWAGRWHDTLQSVCTVLGIDGNGSPEEILVEFAKWRDQQALEAATQSTQEETMEQFSPEEKEVVLKALYSDLSYFEDNLYRMEMRPDGSDLTQFRKHRDLLKAVLKKLKGEQQ
jgi:hypothetical protein